MTTVDDVAAIVAGLPEVTEGERYGHRTWAVADKGFAWVRPLRKADVKRFGDDPVPEGPILALRVADLNEKAAVLAANHRGFFTIPHFDNYAAVLVQLDRAAAGPVREAVVDAWLACAPEALAKEYLGRA